MTQLTNKEFLNRIEAIVGDEYTFLEPYKTRKTKIKVRHNSLECDCYEYLVTPDKFLGTKNTKGTRCPKCAVVNNARRKLLSQKEFDNRVLEKVGTEYNFVESFKGVDTPIKVHHTKCNNTYKVRPANFLSKGTRCPYCYGNNHKTAKEFKQEFYDLEDSENYELLTDYVNATHKVKVTHKVCNTTYEVAPYSFLQGHRCPRCISILKEHTTLGEKYIREYLDSHNISYEYPKLFPDLRDKLTLHYDFYLPEYNVLIEYQGNQHKGPVDYFGGVSYFNTLTRHDSMKRVYAKEHGYIELELWYDKLHTKNDVDDFLNKNLLNP